MQFSNSAELRLYDIAFRFVNSLEIQATFGLLPPKLPFFMNKTKTSQTMRSSRISRYIVHTTTLKVAMEMDADDEREIA